MEEALKSLRACVDDMEKAMPAVLEDPVKNRKSYKVIRERTLTAMQHLKAIRYRSLEAFNKKYYSTHARKGKANASN